jgi:hypothetical protein
MKRFGASFFIVLSLLLILPALTPCIVNAEAVTAIVESFSGTSALGWTLGGTYNPELTSGSYDPSGSGWLRLTRNLQHSVGYAYYNTAFPSDKSMEVSFDYVSWGHSDAENIGADGLCFFLFDGATPTFSPGNDGDDLGYIDLSGGYVGVGLDEYGSLSATFIPGGVQLNPNSVTICGSSNNGYAILKSVLSPSVLSFPLAQSRPDLAGSDYRKVLISITPEGTHSTLTVKIQFGIGAAPTELITNLTLPTRPASYKLGFSAATGWFAGYHELRNVKVMREKSDTSLSIINSPVTFNGAAQAADHQLSQLMQVVMP